METGAPFGQTDASSSRVKKISPLLSGKPPLLFSNSGQTSPLTPHRSPVLSSALMGYGASQLDPIPENDHARRSPESNEAQHGMAPSPIQVPPALVLGPTFSSGSISSLESGSASPLSAPVPIVARGHTEDKAHDPDIEIVDAGGDSDTTVEPRDPGPLTPARVLDTGAKGKRRLSISSGLDKVRSLIGRGNTSLSKKAATMEPDGSGFPRSPSHSSSRRSSTGSAQSLRTPGAEWKNSPDLPDDGFGQSALSGITMRRDKNVLKLTRTESPLAPLPVPTSSASILSRPVSHDHSRTPTPPNILISTANMDIGPESASTPTPDRILKSSSLALTPDHVPGPSPSPSPLFTGPPDSEFPPDRTPTTSGCVTPTPNIMRNPSPLSAGIDLSTRIPPSPGNASQPRRSSLTSPVMNKTKSLDQEAQNLLLNALQRGSGGQQSQGHNHGLSLSRSSTKDSAMNELRKPGVGGALAALGFKTGAAVGATDAVKKSNINVLLPSEPVGAQKTAPTAPGVSLTAPTPHMEQEDPSTNSGSGYFGGRKQKGSRSSRSANKEEKYRRSLSPFFKGRRSLSRGNASEKRDPSPPVGALSDAGESDGESVVSNSSNRYRPQATAFSRSRRRDRTDSEEEDDRDQASDDGDFETDTEYDEDALSHEIIGPDGWVEDVFDPQTEENTKANAIYYEGDAAGLGGEGVLEDEEGHEIEVEVDALGEGPNVVIPPEPLFAQPTMARRPPTPPVNPEQGLAGVVHKEKKKPRPLSLTTSRPEFGRNRCTIKLTQGDPDAALEQSGNRLRSYVVLSDMSAEAGYAIEWCIGTVARDGDEIFLVSVIENDAKVDPKEHGTVDKAQKLRVQRERQGTASALARQVTSLLQRTVLNVSVTCQAIHSKNARHMLLDLIDYLEPTMVIVGSRGLGKLQGILLGSTSHYLVQKSSVPVMVARRRLKRPLRKTDPSTLRHAPRTSLASASIEKTASAKQEDEVLDAGDVDREADQQEIEDQKEREARGMAMGGQGEVVL
ncbi:hypothetical protein NliqN6_4025 [Naganishia liquefaciens]|uniref:UspA domain-containing protein n=1 Tax=Naganishia liquefaciens TaxID=104408 RepID=A0A8H3YFU0_9TREE|nr:hypothetical protein NliqN6_4025 [Naganishia liquefaciens]